MAKEMTRNYTRAKMRKEESKAAARDARLSRYAALHGQAVAGKVAQGYTRLADALEHAAANGRAANDAEIMRLQIGLQLSDLAAIVSRLQESL